MLTCETEKCTNDTLLTPNIGRISVANPDPMILDLPDPDLALFVRIWILILILILPLSSKNSKKNLDIYGFLTFL